MKTIIILLSVFVVGCSTNQKYSCGLPDGKKCQSMDETYDQIMNDEIAMQKVPILNNESRSKKYFHGIDDDDNEYLKDRKQTNNVIVKPVIKMIEPGSPIITAPRIQKIWFNTWTDEDKDVHSEQYIFLRLDNGKWLIDGNN